MTRITSMIRALSARSAFRRRVAFGDVAFAMPNRPPPQRGFAAAPRLPSPLPRPSRVLGSGCTRRLDRSSDPGVRHPRRRLCAGVGGGWSALVVVCRPSDPRARSAGSIEPRNDRPHDRSLFFAGPPWHLGEPRPWQGCARRLGGPRRFRAVGWVAASRRSHAPEIRQPFRYPDRDGRRHLVSRGSWRTRVENPRDTGADMEMALWPELRLPVAARLRPIRLGVRPPRLLRPRPAHPAAFNRVGWPRTSAMAKPAKATP